MPPLRSVLAALVCLLLTTGPAAADAAAPAHRSPWLRIDTYSDDGLFVSGPAQSAGMVTLVLVGGVMAVACTPVDLVSGLVHRKGYGTITAACASEAGQAVASQTYLAFGAPFWLLKRTFWDTPRDLLRREPSEVGKAQPDVG